MEIFEINDTNRKKVGLLFNKYKQVPLLPTGTIDIPVVKIWNDNDNEFKNRPGSIEVILYKIENNQRVDVASHVLTKDEKWNYVFENLDAYDAEGNELHLEDILGTEDNIVTRPIEEELEKKILYTELKNLSDRDKEIMTLRYGLLGKKEMTQKEVAETLGISQSYISRIEKKVINKLRVENN